MFLFIQVGFSLVSGRINPKAYVVLVARIRWPAVFCTTPSQPPWQSSPAGSRHEPGHDRLPAGGRIASAGAGPDGKDRSGCKQAEEAGTPAGAVASAGQMVRMLVTDGRGREQRGYKCRSVFLATALPTESVTRPDWAGVDEWSGA